MLVGDDDKIKELENGEMDEQEIPRNGCFIVPIKKFESQKRQDRGKPRQVLPTFLASPDSSEKCSCLLSAQHVPFPSCSRERIKILLD